MKINEFKERLREINPHLAVEISHSAGVEIIYQKNDRSKTVIFDLVDGKWTAYVTNALTMKEIDQITKLLPKANIKINNSINTKVLDESPSVKQAAKVMENVQKVAKKTGYSSSFKDYTDYLADVLQQKNIAYGDSFGKSLDEDGLLVLKIRLGDKFNRISSLIKKGELKENDESLEDTLLDLAGYSILGLKYLKEHENE